MAEKTYGDDLFGSNPEEGSGFGAAMDDFGDYLGGGTLVEDYGGGALGVGVGVGAYKAKAGIAQNAFSLGHDFAEATGQQTDLRKDVFGGVAATGAYVGLGKGIGLLSKPLTESFRTNLAVGSWSSQVDEVMKVVRAGAERGAELNVRRQYGRQPAGSYKTGAKAATRDRVLNDPVKMKKLVQDRVTKATKKVEKALQEKIKNEVFKKKGMKNSFDKIVNQMVKNPKKWQPLAVLLGKQFPGLAAKLTASTAGVFAPEAVSSVVGAAGIAWTAYDIYQIMEAYPDMGKQIADILFGEEPIEGAVAASLVK